MIIKNGIGDSVATIALQSLLHTTTHWYARNFLYNKKEQASLECNDKWIDIVLDRSRIQHYEGTAMAERMRELGHVHLRMVKIYLDNGNYEVLLTNLPTEKFCTGQLADLYHMRWSVETAYETLKSRLRIENFTGTKPQLLLQDIYSTIYVSNLSEDIILETQQELDEKDKKSRKHYLITCILISAKIWCLCVQTGTTNEPKDN